MKEVSVLIGGKAGDGINSAGSMVAQLLNHLGYRIYMYFDYPSLIRGGHNFTVIRGSEQDIGSAGVPSISSSPSTRRRSPGTGTS